MKTVHCFLEGQHIPAEAKWLYSDRQLIGGQEQRYHFYEVPITQLTTPIGFNHGKAERETL